MFQQQKGEELLTARRITKFKFLQQDSEQIKEYIKVLENFLQMNKQILRELITNNNLNRGNQVIVEENKQIKELIYKATIHKDVAESRVLISEQIADEALRREQESIMKYQEVIEQHVKSLEEKETIAQEVERKIQEYEKEIESEKKKRAEKLNQQNQKVTEEIQMLDHEINFAMETLEDLASEYQECKNNKELISEKFKELYNEHIQLQTLLNHSGRASQRTQEAIEKELQFQSDEDQSYDEFWYGKLEFELPNQEFSSSSSEKNSSNLEDVEFNDKYKMPFGTQGSKAIPSLDLSQVEKWRQKVAQMRNQQQPQQPQNKQKNLSLNLGTIPNQKVETEEVQSINGQIIGNKVNNKTQAVNPNEIRLQKQVQKYKKKVKDIKLGINLKEQEVSSLKRLLDYLQSSNDVLSSALLGPNKFNNQIAQNILQNECSQEQENLQQAKALNNHKIRISSSESSNEVDKAIILSEGEQKNQEINSPVASEISVADQEQNVEDSIYQDIQKLQFK